MDEVDTVVSYREKYKGAKRKMKWLVYVSMFLFGKVGCLVFRRVIVFVSGVRRSTSVSRKN